MSTRPAADAPSGRAGVPARIRADLARRAAVLTAAARRLRRRDDAEAIHDVRVATRRLGAALALWSPLLRPKSRRRAARALRRLRAALGATREHEVMLTMLEARLAGRAIATRRAAEPLAARLRRRVERGRARAARPAVERWIERIAARTGRASTGVEPRAESVPGWLDHARSRAAARATAAREAVALGLERGDDGALHRARIAVKRLRYAEECLRVVTPGPAAGLTDLRRLQHELGIVHDAALLRDRLVREGGRGRRAGHAGDRREHAALVRELERERAEALDRLRARTGGPAGADGRRPAAARRA